MSMVQLNLIIFGVAVLMYIRLSRVNVDLLVLVASARENFAQRKVIRETWANRLYPTLTTQVKIFFVVGNQFCDIPFEDRVHPYSCTLWSPNVTNNETDYQEALVSIDDPKRLPPEHAVEPQYSESYHDIQEFPYQKFSLAFKVLHPITIHRIGLHMFLKSSKSTRSIPVLLYNTVNQEEVTRVQFNNIDPGHSKSSFFYQPVEKFILPRGFEGTLSLESSINIDEILDVDAKETPVFCLPPVGSQVIHFYRKNKKVNCWLVPVLNFIYSLHDPEILATHLQKRDARHKSWLQQKIEEADSLAEEHQEFADILFVSEVDTYRSIPQKLLEAQVEASSSYAFQYLLKTDDDCYIDIEQILAHLYSIGHERFWSGNFRTNWVVERHGKWAEWDYDAIVYPKFACGSGYVISSDLSRSLVQMSDQLKTYQGEDVSMGIWMAALGPHLIEDSRWQCSKTCSHDMFSMPNLSVAELQELWNNKLQCGNPCGCN